VVQLFRVTRELLRKYGTSCRHFGTICVEVLNVRIRPFTARWHLLSEEGKLDTDDGRYRFRSELRTLQQNLREFQRFLGLLSDGNAYVKGTESGFQTVSSQAYDLGEPINFDQLQGLPIGDVTEAKQTSAAAESKVDAEDSNEEIADGRADKCAAVAQILAAEQHEIVDGG